MKFNIFTKLTTLQVQNDTCKMCSSTTLGDFGLDCDEMIAEIEKEVQTTQFHMEAKQKVSEIVHPHKNDPSPA